MGTNYYAKSPDKEPCECCKRPYDNERIHIGKSSSGRKFTFRSYPGLESFMDWVTYLHDPDKIIVNEYGETIDYKSFFNLVLLKQGGMGGGSIDEYGYECPAGFVFSKREFC